MPKYYDAPKAVRDRFFPKAISEQIIGEDEARQEKTYLPEKSLVLLLSLIRSQAYRYIRMFKEMHKRENGVELSNEEILLRYETPKSWVDIHDDLVSHFVSFEGFSIRMAVRAEQMRQEEEEKKESTMQTQEGAKPERTKLVN